MMTSTTFSAPPPAAADRSDFRNIMLSGTKVGLVTGVAVLVYTALFRAIPAGLAREVVEAVVVLATATLVSFLPAPWVVARGSEGIAGAALIAVMGRIAGCRVMLPVTAGGGFTLTLTVLAVAAVARKA